MPKVTRATEGQQVVQITPWQSKRETKAQQLDDAAVIVGMSIKRSASSACRPSSDIGNVSPQAGAEERTVRPLKLAILACSTAGSVLRILTATDSCCLQMGHQTILRQARPTEGSEEIQQQQPYQRQILIL